MEDRVVPATFTVTGLGDTGTGSGSSGDLRYCIAQANAASDVDTIVFQAGVTGTITLSNASQQLTISNPVTITGPGASSLTITSATPSTAGANNRIINISAAVDVGLTGLRLTGGNVTGTGGAINKVGGVLSLTDVVIASNKSSGVGGGIAQTTGTLNLLRTTVTQNNSSASRGAGIDVSPTNGANGVLNLTDSTVSLNTTSYLGAGIAFFWQGTLNVTRSTTSGNVAGNSYGGMYLYGTGMVATITNSTISGNQGTVAGGIGLISSADTLTIRNSTITGNTATGTGTTASGGVTRSTAGTTIIENTVIAGNSQATFPDIRLPSGTLSANNSFFGYIPSSYLATFPGTNQASSTLASPLNPQLGPLQDNGGPTLTRAPLTGSPLLDTGNNSYASALTTDQRGFTRFLNTTVDIGVVEGVSPIPTATLAASPVTTSGGTTYTFTVTYAATAPALIDGGTIGTGDVTVTSPGSFSATPALVTATPGGNAGTVTATYSFTPPGGSWDPTDNGTYTVTLGTGQVVDTAAVNVPGGALGTFVVTAPPPNDAAAGAVTLALGQVVAGTTVGANNDYTLASATTTQFVGLGQSASASRSRRPSAGTWCTAIRPRPPAPTPSAPGSSPAGIKSSIWRRR